MAGFAQSKFCIALKNAFGTVYYTGFSLPATHNLLPKMVGKVSFLCLVMGGKMADDQIFFSF